MRKILLSTVAIAAMSASAVAADLPRRQAAPTPAPIYVTPIFTWSGFYVGLNAGATFNDRKNGLRPAVINNGFVSNDVALYDAAVVGAYNDNNNSAFTGGAQLGYNWQFGSMVAGLETDINYRGGGSKDGYDVALAGVGPFANANRFTYGGGNGGDWFGTLRGRLGFAMDRTLLYATGGLAFGDTGNSGSAYFYSTPGTPIGGTFVSNRNNTEWGWTLGAGIEHAFSNNWTAKLEYLYVNLDSGNTNIVNTLNTAYSFSSRADDKFHVVRVGLNYKFGDTSVAGPVLARY
jgi:outer membrane immunogenic protein